MKQRRWGVRVLVVLAYLAPGMVVLGTSCAADVREAVIDAGVDFIGETVADVLHTLFPVDNLVAGEGA